MLSLALTLGLRVMSLCGVLVGTAVVARGQPISEPTVCIKASYSEQDAEFAFFRTAPNGSEEQAFVTIFGLTPEDPTLFRWGVRAKDYGRYTGSDMASFPRISFERHHGMAIRP